MKSVPLRHMQHHLSELIREVDQGNELLITRRRRPIAKLSPVNPAATKRSWPDFAARAARIKGRPLSATILEERD